MKGHIGIYKLDEGWLNWHGEWVATPRVWWIEQDYVYYNKDDASIFNFLLNETKDAFIHLWNNNDVTDIWLVPFDDESQIHWSDAIRLS